MTKRDLKRELKNLYSAPAKAVVRVEVPPLSYLMIDGQGDPNTSAAYANAVESLSPSPTRSSSRSSAVRAPSITA